MTRIDWADVVDQGAAIARSYDTPVTLRQLFYRLVSAELIPNTTSAYKGLSSKTAEARRNGEFPELHDRTRSIHQAMHFVTTSDALAWLRGIYRRDRTIGQDVSIFLAVEKAGLVEQLRSWFGNPLGIPILALGGYSSQSYVDEVALAVRMAARPGVLLYAGDHDPEGHDILRDFLARTDCWDHVERVALTAEQVDEYDLPPQPGKASSSRAAGFVAKYGELVQVEVDALDPTVLRRLFTAAVREWWSEDAHRQVLGQEERDIEALFEVADLLAMRRQS
jgi:hypothetical protein